MLFRLAARSLLTKSSIGMFARTVVRVPLAHVDSPSKECVEELANSLQFYPNFIDEKEEKMLFDEVNPTLRRMRYQQDHWDNAIVGFRETQIERKNWTPKNRAILERVIEKAKLKVNDDPQSFIHILDLEETGYIKAHVDNLRYCGDKICGICLLSDAIMRFVHCKDPKKNANVLATRRGFYIMSGISRYDYTHAILPTKELFKGQPIVKARRISVISRSKPPADA